MLRRNFPKKWQFKQVNNRIKIRRETKIIEWKNNTVGLDISTIKQEIHFYGDIRYYKRDYSKQQEDYYTSHYEFNLQKKTFN